MMSPVGFQEDSCAIGADNVMADDEGEYEENAVCEQQEEESEVRDEEVAEQYIENQTEGDENPVATIGLLGGQHVQLGTRATATDPRRIVPQRRHHQEQLAADEEHPDAIQAVLVDDSEEIEESEVLNAAVKVVADAKVVEDKPSPSRWICIVVGLVITAIVAVSIVVPLATKRQSNSAVPDPSPLESYIHPTELLENRTYTYHVVYLASQTTCANQLSVLVECEDGKIRDLPPDIGCLRNEEDEDDRGVICLLETNKAYSIHFGCSWESGGKGGLKEAAAASLTLIQSTRQSSTSTCSDEVVFNVARYCKGDLFFSPCLSSDPVLTNKSDTACTFRNLWMNFNQCFLSFCPKATDANLGREICNEEQARPGDFLDAVEEYNFEAWSSEWLAAQLN